MVISTVLGAKIRYYRTLCGKTQKELANALNLDVAAFLTISKKEKELALSRRKK